MTELEVTVAGLREHFGLELELVDRVEPAHQAPFTEFVGLVGNVIHYTERAVAADLLHEAGHPSMSPRC